MQKPWMLENMKVKSFEHITVILKEDYKDQISRAKTLMEYIADVITIKCKNVAICNNNNI